LGGDNVVLRFLLSKNESMDRVRDPVRGNPNRLDKRLQLGFHRLCTLAQIPQRCRRSASRDQRGERNGTAHTARRPRLRRMRRRRHTALRVRR
jgi:hypothetical protein